MTTLARIAASFGVEATDLAAMVGMSEVGVDTPLTPQQVDCSPLRGLRRQR